MVLWIWANGLGVGAAGVLGGLQQYLFRNALGIIVNPAVPEADHRPPFRREELRAVLVLRRVDVRQVKLRKDGARDAEAPQSG
jgi:hypothetical protein